MSYVTNLKRLELLGIEHPLGSQIHQTIIKWVSSSGEEWTVKRLKDIRSYYLMYKDGNYTPPPWLSIHRDGTPKGVFRNLFRRKLSRRVWSILRSYTAFVSKTVTKDQRDKFIHSVESEPVPIPFIPFFREVAFYLNSLMEDERIASFKDVTFSPDKFAPNRYMKSMPESIECLFEDANSSVVDDFINDDRFKDFFADAYDSFFLRVLLRKGEIFKGEPEYCPYVGKVSVIQEPGFKARFIANPKRIFQVVLKPLGDQLFSLLKKLPWDCTYEQELGPKWVQAQLIAGKTCHSVDLSDASNNIPLNLQTRLYSWCSKINQDRLKLFEEVSKGYWFLPTYIGKSTKCQPKNPNDQNNGAIKGDPENSIRWTKGQPLGLYPSFPSFAILHGAILRSIELKLKLADTFRVLGDDVVISDDAVHREYRGLLDLLHIPISVAKSISSKKFAEFAGVLITRDQILYSHKWRPITASNILTVYSSTPRTLDWNNPIEYLSWMIRAMPKPFGEGNTKDEKSLVETAKILAPLYVTRDEDDDVPFERHTKDFHFRSSSLYGDVFSDPEVTARETLVNLVNITISSFEELNAAVSKLSSRSHSPAVPDYVSGAEVYKRLDNQFRFSSGKIRKCIADQLYLSEIAIVSDNIWKTCQKEWFKPSFLSLFRNRVIDGQCRVLGYKPKTFQRLIEEIVMKLYCETWSDLPIKYQQKVTTLKLG